VPALSAILITIGGISNNAKFGADERPGSKSGANEKLRTAQSLNAGPDESTIRVAAATCPGLSALTTTVLTITVPTPIGGCCADHVRKLIGARGSGVLAMVGGAEGNRTPDLLIANEALSHLSYGPAIPATTADAVAQKVQRVGAI
jgi:hypothetical protein